MIRVGGTILRMNKQVWIALKGIYGVGNYRAFCICKKNNINPFIKILQLTDKDINMLQLSVNQYECSGDLKRHIRFNIKRLHDIKCYRGVRHKKSLPVRGQRSKTNAKTIKLRIMKL